MSAVRLSGAARLRALASVAAVTICGALSSLTFAQSQPTNASFETPTLSSVSRTALPTTATWTFSGTAGIERFDKASRPYFVGGYHGDQAAYLSSTGTAGSLGSVAQSINFPAAGTYQLRFLAGRLGAANALRITVGGVAVDTDIVPRAPGQASNPVLEVWWTAPFTVASAGSLEVKFAATVASATQSGGNYLYVDQVTAASVPTSIPNVSFESGAGWTLAGGAAIGGTTIEGASGSGALYLRAPGASSGGTATSTAVTVPAGVYSVSARITAAQVGNTCTTSFGYMNGSSFVAVAALPTPGPLLTFESVTTPSFSLPAGTYSFRLSEGCIGSYEPIQIDALSLNYAGPNFGNAGFETPDLGNPTSDIGRPQQSNPSGASWTFTSGSIYGNGGSSVTDRPRTSMGKQYGRGGGQTGGTGNFSQAVTLDPGTYIVVARASDGVLKLAVNGTLQSYTMFGATTLHPAGGTAFAEVQSDPFTVSVAGSVTLAFSGADAQTYGIDQVRIMKISGVAPANTPPTVSLGLTVNGQAAQAVAWAGSTLQATATASDSDGLQRIRVLRNGVALAPENTATAPASAASPLIVSATLQTGNHTFTAEATDHLGAVSTASQSINVLAAETLLNGGFETPSQVGVTNGFTQNPTGADWTFLGRSSIQRNGSAWVAPNAPEGFQTAALQCGSGMTAGSIWQDVGFASAKTIQITLRWATRTYNGQTLAQPIQLRVGGVNQALFASSANAAFTQYTSPSISVGAGTQRIEMSATQCDSDRTTFIDQVTLTAVNTPPAFSAFTVSPTAVQTSPVALTLASTASDPDTAGYVASIDYEYKRTTDASFSAIAGQSCTNNVSSPSRPFSCNAKTWTPPSPGSYVLRAKATDDASAVTYANEVPVAVCGPTVALTAPANGTSYGVNAGGQASITLTATVGQYSTNAACGTLTQLQFLLNGNPISGALLTPTAGTSTYSYTVQYPASASPYAFSAQVTEAGVRSATSATASVTVAVNSPPQITSIAPVASFIAGQAGTVRATASDPGGGINSIQITAQLTTGGPVYTQTCSSVVTCDLAIATAAAGLYQVTVVATDNQNTQTTSTTLIATSEAPNAAALDLPSTSTIGTTAGQFAVSESGAATYSIPIAVAPGVNGVQPGLALTYNSQGGDGHVGVGWGVGGTSYITRCPKTIATDGIRDSINYDNVTDPVTGNDAFCLDGQRLVPVSGGLTSVSCNWPVDTATVASCAAWEFRTEVDSYSRIIGIGDNVVNGSSGSGPTRFRAYAKSGQVLEYGSRWWGVGAPRPDPTVSLITNASFEDTTLNDSCYAIGGPPCTIILGDPNWAGLGPAGLFKTYNTGASSEGWEFTDGGGVQRNGSAMSPSGPSTTAGQQTAFLQALGSATARPYLEEGWYRLTFKLAGRGNSGSGFGGDQTVAISIDGGPAAAMFTTTTGQAFSDETIDVYMSGNSTHSITFAGQRSDDQMALLDDIRLVPINRDIYSIKIFPLDRVEDRNGNYLHIDYGGTHGPQTVTDSNGNTASVNGTLLSSYGSAKLPIILPATENASIAQGARPALEMYPRRFTYGMRTSTPGQGNNLASVAGVEVARVILNYEVRPDVSKLYDTGAGQMLLSRRLKSIYSLVGGVDDTSLRSNRDSFHTNEINNNNASGAQCTTGVEANCGTLVRRYVLNYTQSPNSQRSRLDSVTECSGDGLCLAPTTFTWQNATLTLNGAGSGFQAKDVGTDWNDLLTQGRVADIVGDGRSRIIKRVSNGQAMVVCTHGQAQQAGQPIFGCSVWNLPLKPASQFPYELPGGGVNRDWFLSDVNGDGIADVLAITGNNAFACLSTGSGFGSCATTPSATGNPRYYAKTGDFDGDGRMDVLFYRGGISFELCRTSGGVNPTDVLGWSCNPLTQVEDLRIAFPDAASQLDNIMIADFNGDGRTDIAWRIPNQCVTGGQRNGYDVIPPTPGEQCKNSVGQFVYPNVDDSYWSVCFATGKADQVSFKCATRSGGNIAGAVKAVAGKPSQVATYDFNGDGLADMATQQGSGWRVCLSSGDGEFANRDSAGECPVWDGPSGPAKRTVAGDFNGDGRTDLAYYNDATSSWQICMSTGTGFQLPCTTLSQVAKPADCSTECAEAFVGDYNGDGISDLAVNTHCTISCGRLTFGLSGRTMPDLVASVTTALGAQTRIDYLPLTRSEVYTKSLPDVELEPLLDNEIAIQSPMYVVYRTRGSTATAGGQWYRTEYGYEGLRADKRGRGLYGFFRRSIVDNVAVSGNGGIVDGVVVQDAVDDSAHAQATGVINSMTWPMAGRPKVLTKSAKNAAGVYIAVSSVRNVYASRSRSSGVARTNGVGGTYMIAEAFTALSVQNPRYDTAGGYFPAGVSGDLQGGALPTTITYSGIDPLANTVTNPASGTVNLAAYYDVFGNPLKMITKTLHPSNSEVWTQQVDNAYYNSGGDTTRWLLGKLQTATTTTGVSGYTTNGATSVTRKSSFAYQGYGGTCTGAVYGQLCSETVEPDAQTGTGAPYNDRSLFQQSAYEYDAFGNRSKSTVSYFDDAAGTGGLQTRASTTTYQYGKYPLVSTRLYTGNSALDLADTREYTNARCRVATKVTDANGNYATTEFDGFCRKVRETAWTHDGKRAKESTFTLTTAGISGAEVYALETRSADVTNADRRTSIQYHDNLQRVVRAQGRAFDGSYSQSTTVFDALGRQLQVIKPVSSGSSSTTATTSFAYDGANRVTTETLPDSNTVTTVYAGLTTTVTRTNTNGTAGATNSATAHVTQKTANAKGLVATVVTNPANALSTTASYAYDAIGNLTQVSTPGAGGSTLVKSMSYDLRGRQFSLNDPDAGTYTYGYNGTGEQVRQADQRNYEITTGYDSFGRKKTRSETQAAGGNATTTWIYDTCGDNVTSRAKGLLCSTTYSGTGGASNQTSKAAAYDKYARPVTTTTVIAGKTFQSQVAYDANGRPQYAVYPQPTAATVPLAVQSAYNDRGFAFQSKNAVTGFVYQTITSRNADGQLKQSSLGGGLLTLTQSYGIDGLARIAGIDVTLTSNGTNVLGQTFGFESIGNLKNRSLASAVATGSSTRSENESFSYDLLDRLTQNSGTGITDTGSYVLDLAGNLTNKAGVAMGHTLGSNRLCNIGATTSCSAGTTGNVSYDLSGNVLSYTRPSNGSIPGADGAAITLAGYTAFNLPTSVQKSIGGSVTASAEFAYDAGYQRVRQIKRAGPVQTGGFADDILYVVPGGFEVHLDSSGNIVRSISTVSGADGAIATVSATYDATTGQPLTVNAGTDPVNNTTSISGTGTVTKVLLKDHLSSMVAEVTILGTAGSPQVSFVATYSTLAVHGFGPWGNARHGLNGDLRGFTGHEHLAELGLIHMNGRLYDSMLGRFLQADPIIQAPHNVQSHNRYVYVLNNPLSLSDPSGFSWWTKNRNTVLSIAAAAFMQWYLMPELLLGTAFGECGIYASAGNAISAMASGFAAGGIAGGNIQSALQGAFFAGVTFGLASEFGLHGAANGWTDAKLYGQVALHAAVGCAQSAAAGGSCRAGAVGGGVGAFASPALTKLSGPAKLVASALVGGIASKLGGGKFENGALSATFGYLFNEVGTHAMRGYASAWMKERLDVIRGWAEGAGDKAFLRALDRVTVVEEDRFAERGGRPVYASQTDNGYVVTIFNDFWKLSISDKYAVLVHEIAHATDENRTDGRYVPPWETVFRTSKALDFERKTNDIAMRILRVGPRVTELPQILRDAQE